MGEGQGFCVDSSKALEINFVMIVRGGVTFFIEFSHLMILDDQFVRGDTDVKSVRFSPAHAFQSSLLLTAVIGEDLNNPGKFVITINLYYLKTLKNE